LVHRDLYPDQVLVSDDRSALVDLDEVAVGEPELDLGNFTAHLTLGDLQRNGAIGASAARSSAFLRAYHGAREIARHRLAVYEAGALVRLASLERLASQGGATLSWSTLVRELTARAERAMDSERRDPTL
jgi:aminoglycoside phosphotransferase (APT) family kinase protein